jgi:Uma2 family endonuclease
MPNSAAILEAEQTRLWRGICLDKRFEDAPYKIETNVVGQIIMSPTRNWHGYYAATIARLLGERMNGGKVLVECAVETTGGIKVADATWVSDARFEVIKDQFSSSTAPEICVEVLSPSNTLQEMMEKKDLYLAAGAVEYWLCDQNGLVQFLNESGMLEQSQLCPDFPRRVGQ